MQMEYCERGSLTGLRHEFDTPIPESALWTILRSLAEVRKEEGRKGNSGWGGGGAGR
jgi:hypothetical protein